jgi:hypothetical protein
MSLNKAGAKALRFRFTALPKFARLNFFFGLLIALAVLVQCTASRADDRKDALALLDQWTSIRWGDDNLTWVVHYPDEFVDLWVRSEAEKGRMTPQQADEYRKSFTDELRTGAATAVLLSVHAFGQNPINLAPLAKNISLVDSSGKRSSPIAFEKKLDGPLNGLVQGLVFFPKQAKDDFAIAVNGLAREGETIFSFQKLTNKSPAIATEPQISVKTPQPPSKETVIKIPTKKPEPPQPPKSPTPPERTKSAEPETSAPGEVFPPTKLPEPPEIIPPEIPTPGEESSAPSTASRAPSQTEKSRALEAYLRAWIDGDASRMYSMLSAESKARISRELFEREVLSDGFRRGLRAGYKIDWSGDSAKVVVSRRLLFMKTLDSKLINFVAEDGSARVEW